MTKGNRMNSRQLHINMLANIVSYSVNLIISFFLTPFIINVIGKESYSFYPSLSLSFLCRNMAAIQKSLNRKIQAPLV